MKAEVHPSSLVHPDAKLHPSVKVGPFSIIGPHVEMDEGCEVMSHSVIEGHTKIGKNNKFFAFCSIGAPAQDLTYKGEPTRVEIGNNNVFREYVSIHKGTLKENQITIVKNNCFLMAHVHLGHDVIVGDNCIFANSVNLAGHVKIGDRVIIGGGTNVSQFVTLGRGAYIGGASAIDRDVPVFCTGLGNRLHLKGINIIGLRRLGVAKASITEIVDFYRLMEASALSPRAFVERAELMEEFKSNEIVQEMAAQIRSSEIGIAPFTA